MQGTSVCRNSGHAGGGRLKVFDKEAFLIGEGGVVASVGISTQQLQRPMNVPFEHQPLDHAAAGEKGP